MHVNLEDRQPTIRISLHRGGHGSGLSCTHAGIETGREWVGLDDHDTRADLSDSVEGVSKEALPSSTPVLAGLNPKVFKRPSVTSVLERIKSDQLPTPRADKHQLMLQML